ncbi:hypothetical protein [Streptomyces sp. NPDC001508]|uniref:effector-associated constant component EACC1 n=1 Tax=Streptomyces sp. NPDC001508 TaxID=3154656 RepID=UPI00332F5310
MRVEVRVGEEQDELRSLYRWLREDEELRSVRISLSGTGAAPGEMGSALDLIEVLLDNAWSAASLAVAVVAWRRSRPRAGRATLRIGQTEVEITGDDEEQVRRLVALCADADGSRQPAAPADEDANA